MKETILSPGSGAKSSFGSAQIQQDVWKRNGAKKAMLRRKKDFETQRHKKAAQLRKYARLCAAEGISSKRVNLNPEKGSVVGSNVITSKSKKENEKKPLPRAIQLAMERSEQIKEQRENEKQRFNEALKEKEEALRRRKEKKQLLMKTNRKGQPNLGNHMKAMLEKIKKSTDLQEIKQ